MSSPVPGPVATTSPSGQQPSRPITPSMQAFHTYLASLTHPRILALCGAGLSAASGLPTFRGAGGMWKTQRATELATRSAFERDPGLVWQFYAYRRHMALQARPNRAHAALAQLGQVLGVGTEGGRGFACLSQNVDGLSPRARHPEESLFLLHGSLFDIHCFNRKCDYVGRDNFADPLCPALDASNLSPSVDDRTRADATSSSSSSSSSAALDLPASSGTVKDIARSLDPARRRASSIPTSELPHCPRCHSLLRPGVVWFGESLPDATLARVSDWCEAGATIDLMLVIGTTAGVWPAAGYIDLARQKGARVAVVNLDAGHMGAAGTLTERDWMFQGDAGEIVPEMLAGLMGKVSA